MKQFKAKDLYSKQNKWHFSTKKKKKINIIQTPVNA